MSHPITQLVINSLGGTHTRTHIHTHTHTHTHNHGQKQFQETRCTPGLKSKEKRITF